MNRLIIIGNGFDLAHGLKTSYEHFLLDYFQGYFKAAISKNDIEPIKDEFTNEFFLPTEFNEDQIEEIFTNLNTFSELLQHPSISVIKLIDNKNIQTELKQNKLVCRIKSRFFNGLIENKNWTDIENYYFQKLLEEFASQQFSAVPVNGPFELLSRKIFDYLEKENERVQNVKNHKYQQFINSMFHRFDSSENDLMFVNFNYTNLLDCYTSFDHQDEHSVIQIHGKINNRDSLIFGYGDDSHKRYADLEDASNDEYLIHIKSHRYNSDDNYDKLINFIESGVFEVYVVGHSLGVSDRVLLQTIFEHQDCINIRLYHRGTNDNHFKKRIALSRHFKNKEALRKKIVHFTPEHLFN